MAPIQEGSTRQLHFAARKLLKLVAACVVLSFGTILIPLDRSIASGDAAGPWNKLLYEVGPTGRWAIAVACIGFFLFGALRLTIVAASDQIALRVGEGGVFVRTILKRQQVPWRDILTIDLSSTKVRRRTRRSVRVRIRFGDGEKSLLVPLSLLNADEDDVADWVRQARRAHADSQTPQIDQLERAPRSSFGRKRTVGTS